VLLSGGAIFAQGLLGFSKEGMFTPMVCWLVAAASQRYKLTLLHLAAGIAGVLFMFLFLVPYSQYGRNMAGLDQPLEERIATATRLLSNLGEVRQEYNESNDEGYSESPGYFNTSQGFLDRLQMISVDDGLIAVTDRTGTFGYFPVIFGFENLVPHVFWPSKPSIAFGTSSPMKSAVCQKMITRRVSPSARPERLIILGVGKASFLSLCCWIMFLLYSTRYVAILGCHHGGC
jgi:hypothetical protein